MHLLNDQQETAVQHVQGPLLVLAGAGSGKTRVVTFRIAHLIDIGTPSSKILAVTFTNKAAEEMKHRIRTLKNAQVLSCTFHSLGAKILRESIGALGYQTSFSIYDEEDSEKLLKTCLEQLQIDKEKGLLKKIRLQISSAKNDLLSPDAVKNENLLQETYALYQHKLKECNALDFDDLLYLPVQLFRMHSEIKEMYQNRWSFLLIDEYQDTNLAQYTLAKNLVETHQNIFAVGDPDQSIYSWRGARYENILNFASDFPGAKVITLDQNYRSTNTILQGANALIQKNSQRYDKRLWSALGEGSKIKVYVGQNEKQEAEFVAGQIIKHASNDAIAFDHMAIFYRTNAQSRAFEDVLLARRAPYTIIGGVSFYDRREVKDLLAFLKMIISDTDLISFLRTIHIPRRGLGPATVDKMTLTAANHRIPIFTFCEELLSSPHFSSQVKLSPKQKEGLHSYVHLIHQLRHRKSSMKIHELISEAISLSYYLNYIKEDPETFQDRKENIEELIAKAAEWEDEREEPSLSQFLEELSLRIQTIQNQDTPSIKLMTLHNSKGMEFDLVFLVGLEEDLFPHINTIDNEKAIEEERRLCYVGMTRAKRELYLCSAIYRYMWGTARLMRPSRFLKEIPAQYLQKVSTSHISHVEETSAAETFTLGDQVLHQQFGVGVVKQVTNGSLGLTYEVYFPHAQISRTLVAKYAKLIAHPNVMTE
jgi:DNA helicase-2/ATP-dependent DNA helicase PcrA